MLGCSPFLMVPRRQFGHHKKFTLHGHIAKSTTDSGHKCPHYIRAIVVRTSRDPKGY